MIKRVITYVTSDGREFKDERDATEWEIEVESLMDCLDEDKCYIETYDGERILPTYLVRWLKSKGLRIVKINP